jgi:hypothetical protein
LNNVEGIEFRPCQGKNIRVNFPGFCKTGQRILIPDNAKIIGVRFKLLHSSSPARDWNPRVLIFDLQFMFIEGNSFEKKDEKWAKIISYEIEKS